MPGAQGQHAQRLAGVRRAAHNDEFATGQRQVAAVVDARVVVGNAVVELQRGARIHRVRRLPGIRAARAGEAQRARIDGSRTGEIARA